MAFVPSTRTALSGVRDCVGTPGGNVGGPGGSKLAGTRVVEVSRPLNDATRKPQETEQRQCREFVNISPLPIPVNRRASSMRDLASRTFLRAAVGCSSRR